MIKISDVKNFNEEKKTKLFSNENHSILKQKNKLQTNCKQIAIKKTHTLTIKMRKQ